MRGQEGEILDNWNYGRAYRHVITWSVYRTLEVRFSSYLLNCVKIEWFNNTGNSNSGTALTTIQKAYYIKSRWLIFYAMSSHLRCVEYYYMKISQYIISLSPKVFQLFSCFRERSRYCWSNYLFWILFSGSLFSFPTWWLSVTYSIHIINNNSSSNSDNKY